MKYTFELRPGVPLRDAEVTLRLALLAAEGLHGQAAVRLAAAHQVDPRRRVVEVDAYGPIGDGVVRLFTTFLTREYGDDAFDVQPGYDAGAAAPLAGAA